MKSQKIIFLITTAAAMAAALSGCSKPVNSVEFYVKAGSEKVYEAMVVCNRMPVLDQLKDQNCTNVNEARRILRDR